MPGELTGTCASCIQQVVEYLPGNATTPLKDVKVLAKAVKQNRKYADFNDDWALKMFNL